MTSDDLDDERLGLLVSERLRAVDAMPVPAGDLGGLRRQARHRARARRLAVAAGLLVVAAGAAAALSGGQPAQDVTSTNEPEPAATTTTTQPQVPVTGEAYWKNWDANVPVAVGDTDVRGFILPAESDAMDAAITAYAFAHGATATDGLGPEMTEALTIVHAIAVRDSGGETVGWWAHRFYDLDAYAEARIRAQDTIGAWEAAHPNSGN